MRQILNKEIANEMPNMQSFGTFNEAFVRYSGYMIKNQERIVRGAIKDFDENVKAYNTKEKNGNLSNRDKYFRSEFKSSLSGAKAALRAYKNKK
jgi:hypothetical protein